MKEYNRPKIIIEKFTADIISMSNGDNDIKDGDFLPMN